MRLIGQETQIYQKCATFLDHTVCIFVVLRMSRSSDLHPSAAIRQVSTTVVGYVLFVQFVSVLTYSVRVSKAQYGQWTFQGRKRF